MSRVNILSLHRMGDPETRRAAVRALEYMLVDYAPECNVIVHDADLPIPEYIKDLEFHGIVLGPTFLGNRRNKRKFDRTLKEYDFVRQSSACKIALPQDDYDCSGILDDWMEAWGIDRVYTVCPSDWDALYPRYSKSGDIRLAYTGYITDDMIESWKAPRPSRLRSIDVSYRTHDSDHLRCGVRNLKYAIAARFSRAVAGENLKIDISSRREDLIPGVRWHDFMEDSRFCLAAPSGSSLLDARGEFRRSVEYFVLKNPGACFQEVASACFPEDDGKYLFTPISPRNIEAAMAGTVQIATPGSYSGLMQPMEHYIPLDEDCGNIKEVLEMMDDRELASAIGGECKELMLGLPELRFSNHVAGLVDFIGDYAGANRIKGASQEVMLAVIDRYQWEMKSISARQHLKLRLIENAKRVAANYGVRHFMHFLSQPKIP